MLALLASILVLTSAEPVTTVAVTDQPAGLGPTFDGVGGNSAGGGTRLLLDYPEQACETMVMMMKRMETRGMKAVRQWGPNLL
jgi:hypothetical protein